jgi:predicted transposase YbfD/YdcC
VPANPSSSIPAALAHLAHADPPRPADAPHLLAYLAAIHDPRRDCGRRHPLAAILVIAAAAVLAGARSVTAIAEWAADTPSRCAPRSALGVSAPTAGRCRPRPRSAGPLARVDATALAAVIGAWLAGRDHPGQRRRAVAVDGKTLRGARPDGRQVHLLAAMDHTTRAVLAQRQVDGAPGEVPAFAPLLAGLELAGAVVTADALHTHADAAEFVVTTKQAHHLFTVKANQPILLAGCGHLPWRNVPVLDRTRDRAHGRIELRTLKAVTRQPLRVPARRPGRPGHPQDPRPQGPQVADRGRLYGHQPPFAQARPARLADLLRGHWAIEDGLHWVRDVTFAEDASQVRTGTAPQVMACLRNLAIGVLSRSGPVNLAAALRHHARDPTRPLATLGIALG